MFNPYFGSGSRFQSHISKNGYKEQRVTFSGPLIDLSWMYYLCDQAVTTDDTPGAGFYTHVYDSTVAHQNPPKSFKLMRVLTNDNGSSVETKISLWVGCTVINVSLDGGQDGTINASFEVLLGKEVAGVALTTPPTYPAKDFFNFFDGVLTWTKATVALKYMLQSFKYEFTTDKRFNKGNVDYFATAVLSPNRVAVKLNISARAMELDVYDDTQDDPHTDHAKIATFKISRNTTNDYLQFSFVNCFQDLESQDFVDGFELVGIDTWINPHETGSKHTITEVNNLDDDRYET